MRLGLILSRWYKLKKTKQPFVMSFPNSAFVTYWLILFTRAFTRASHLSITMASTHTIGNESSTTNSQPTGGCRFSLSWSAIGSRSCQSRGHACKRFLIGHSGPMRLKEGVLKRAVNFCNKKCHWLPSSRPLF